METIFGSKAIPNSPKKTILKERSPDEIMSQFSEEASKINTYFNFLVNYNYFIKFTNKSRKGFKKK